MELLAVPAVVTSLFFAPSSQVVRNPTKSELCPDPTSTPATNGHNDLNGHNGQNGQNGHNGHNSHNGHNGHGPSSVTSVSDSSDDSESDDSEAGGPDLVMGAHRLVLAMASPVFQTTLYEEQSGDRGRPVTVRSWDPGTFKLMIE